MKNRSHRYDMNIATNMLNRNYDMCLIIMTVIGIKPHLRNIWSSSQEKVKQIVVYSLQSPVNSVSMNSRPLIANTLNCISYILFSIKSAVIWDQNLNIIPGFKKRRPHQKKWEKVNIPSQ